MVWYIIAAIAAAVALAVLIYNFMSDRRYERQRPLDAMDPELREEVDREREESMKRRELFREALDDATEKDQGGS